MRKICGQRRFFQLPTGDTLIGRNTQRKPNVHDIAKDYSKTTVPYITLWFTVWNVCSFLETRNPDDCLLLLLYFPLVTHTTAHTIALSSHCITSCGKWWLPREGPLGGKKNHPARKVGGNVRTGQSGGPAPIITSWSSTCCHLGKQFHH